MFLLIASITLSIAFSCLLVWKCGLVINIVRTHRGIVSHIGALDMSHLLLLLDLAHVLLFFLQGAIFYMVTLLLAPEASAESPFLLKLHLGGLGGFAILPRSGTTALGCGTAAS